ncbi:hypothetical protein FOCC_FOCC004585 [Frankliniella occidentalis]|nr:hypothetical protein FOCC_FOCC004585 [Frankliniella occidentalis]
MRHQTWASNDILSPQPQPHPVRSASLLDPLRNMLLRAALVAALAVAVLGYSDDLVGHSVLRVTPRSEEQLLAVHEYLQRNPMLDVWLEPRKEGLPVDVNVSPRQREELVAFLGRLGLDHEVFIADLHSLVRKQKLSATRALTDDKPFDWTKYQNLDEIYKWFEALKEKYPTVVSIVNVGQSHEKRDMKGLVIKFADNLPVAMLEAGIHAREWIAHASATYFIDQILKSAESDNNRNWRKTRSTNWLIFKGVDANRNWPFKWGAAGSSPSPASEIYAGPSAESEVETQNLRAHVDSLASRMHIYISLHSYSQLLMFPWGWTDKLINNHNDLNAIARKSVEAIKSVGGTEFTYGDISSTIYPASGSTIDYVYSKCVPYPFVYELRDTGKYGFMLPEDQIIPAAQETWAGVKVIVDEVYNKGLPTQNPTLAMQRHCGPRLALLLVLGALASGAPPPSPGTTRTPPSHAATAAADLVPERLIQHVIQHLHAFTGAAGKHEAAHVTSAKHAVEANASRHGDVLKHGAEADLTHQDAAFHGHKVLRVLPASEQQVRQLRAFLHDHPSLDTWMEPSQPLRPVDMRVSPNDSLVVKEFLVKQGLIYKWMQGLAKRFPYKVQVVEAGRTYEGRSILGVRIKFSNESLPVALLEAGIHAREWITPATATFLTNELLTREDDDFKAAMHAYEWHIFPVANPDGYVYTHTSNRLWRKSRSRYNYLCQGADLNRNWPFHWREVGASPWPCADTYAGTGPESEPETKGLRRYIDELIGRPNSTLHVYVSLHSYSQLLMFPWGFTLDDTKDHDDLNAVAGAAAEAAAKRYGTKFRYGPIAKTICVKYPFVFELRDEGAYGFLLPKDQIKPAAEETVDAINVIVSEALKRK